MINATKLRKSFGTLLVLSFVVVVAGCRVPDDGSPREIPKDQVPFDLLSEPTTAPPSTSPIPTAESTIYLVQGDHLVGVKRFVPAPAGIGSALSALVQGPRAEESAQGISSSVGPQASDVQSQIQGATAIVDITDAFLGIGVQEQVTGFAQIVYTLTEVPGVQDVRIQLNGQPASVPRGDGSATTEPLTREMYATLAPR
jgi:hypothetical protein